MLWWEATARGAPQAVRRAAGMPPDAAPACNPTRRVVPDDEKTEEDAAEGAGDTGAPRAPAGSRRARRGARGAKGAGAADADGDGAAAENGDGGGDGGGGGGGGDAGSGGGGGGDAGTQSGGVGDAGGSALVHTSTLKDFGVVGGDGSEETWDLCLLVDPVTDDQEAAHAEVDFLFSLFRKEGLTVTNPHPLDPKAGFTGEVFALCTASQDELEQEAEIMGLNKPLKLPPAAQKKFAKSERYGRVTAPFTVARKAQFHEVPYLVGDYVMKPEEDPSGLKYFSACERQALLEHMIESKIRQAVKEKKLQPKTKIDFFPLHDNDGEGSRDLVWLQKEWARPLRPKRLLAVLKLWQNPHNGLDEPISEVRDYFGDQIAIYFAFLGFYTRWLTYPAFFGIAFQIWSGVVGEDNLGLVIYCVFICCWSVPMMMM